MPCQVTSRGRPTLTESRRPITFPNDDHRNLDVNRSVPTVGANIPEKCAAVSEKIMLKKRIQRDDDSKKRNPALVSLKTGT